MYVKFSSLPVDDVDRAIAFYTGKLRLTLTTDATMGPGARWVELSFPEGNTCLLLETRTAPPREDRPAAVFVVPDVDAAFERLDALGVEFTSQPQQAPWDAATRYAMFRDSEGNAVLIEDR